MSKGAFNTTFMTGDEYKELVGETERAAPNLMTEAGFLAQSVSVRLRDRPSPVPEPHLAGAHGRRAWTSASYPLGFEVETCGTRASRPKAGAA